MYQQHSLIYFNLLEVRNAFMFRTESHLFLNEKAAVNMNLKGKEFEGALPTSILSAGGSPVLSSKKDGKMLKKKNSSRAFSTEVLSRKETGSTSDFRSTGTRDRSFPPTFTSSRSINSEKQKVMAGLAPEGSQFDSRQYDAKMTELPGNEQESFASYDEVYDSFDAMGLQENLLRGIYAFGFEKPSAIQQRGIVPFCQGLDIILQAQSGTGRIATFCSGILQQLDYSSVECQALVVAPSRELVQQIAKLVRALGGSLGVKVHASDWATSVPEEQRILQNGVHAVVGTPGSVFDMLLRRFLRPDHIKMFVLEEAEELLSRVFKDQMYDIFQRLPPKIQVGAFSATMPAEALEITRKFMNKPVRILVKPDDLTHEGMPFPVRSKFQNTPVPPPDSARGARILTSSSRSNPFNSREELSRVGERRDKPIQEGLERPGDMVALLYHGIDYNPTPKPSLLRGRELDISKYDCYGGLESMLIQYSGGLYQRRPDGTIYLPDIFYYRYREEYTRGRDLKRRLYSESWEAFRKSVTNIFVLRPRRRRPRRGLRI